MGTILIDKLLSTCLKRRASDLHIAVGQVPIARIDGRLQMLERHLLQSVDVASMVETITPNRCKQELRQTGETNFNFGFGDVAKVGAHVGWHRGHLWMKLQLS